MDTSVAAAAAALRGILWGIDSTDELVELSVKSHTGRGGWRSWHMPGPQLWDPATVEQIGEWSRKGRDVYFSACGLVGKPNEPWRRGGAGLRGTAGALWVDIDCQAPGRDDDGHFVDLPTAIDAVDGALRALGGEWGQTLVDSALVIGSGWGVQYWFPLRHRVPAVEASRLTRVLCGAIAAHTDKKIDRLWDVTRVFRMPGTWNWRAGDDSDAAVPSGVVRWPSLAGRGGRPTYENYVSILLGEAVNYGEGLTLTGTGGWSQKVDKLLETFCGVEHVESESVTGGDFWDWDEGVSIEDLADEVWSWEEVLEPHGWTKREADFGVEYEARETVWLRPGKTDESGGRWSVSIGERSAVVYADKPQLLVVYSDSPETGFANGLRGAGRRGDAAGVGVISKWRAWVDLNYAGDVKEALKSVWAGDCGQLSVRWKQETAWMDEAGEEMVYDADRLAGGGLR